MDNKNLNWISKIKLSIYEVMYNIFYNYNNQQNEEAILGFIEVNQILSITFSDIIK